MNHMEVTLQKQEKLGRMTLQAVLGHLQAVKLTIHQQANTLLQAEALITTIHLQVHM